MVTPLGDNLRPGRIIPDLKSESVNSPRTLYLIPFTQTHDEEKGSIFRAEHCFDPNQMECPLYNICSLVLEGKVVTGARLDTVNLNLIPEEAQINITREMIDPVLNEKVIKPYTISSLNEAALCTTDRSIDPFYNKQKPRINTPPMPEDPPFDFEDFEAPVKGNITSNTKEEVEYRIQYIAQKLPGLEDEPPQFDSEFDLLEVDEIHPDDTPNDSGNNDDIGIHPIDETEEEPPANSELPTQNNSDIYEDDNDGYEFDWQRYIH